MIPVYWNVLLPLFASLWAVDGLTVVDGVVNGDVPLQRDPHGHEDGAGHGDGEERVKEEGEEQEVQVGGRVEGLAHGLQDRTHQVAGVHANEGDQQEVERVPHVFPGIKQEHKIDKRTRAETAQTTCDL